MAVDFVRDKVDLHMEHVAPAESDLRYAVPARANQAEVGQNIQRFRIKGGPADEVAFHDFYNLQIAFEPIWTEVFDNKLVDAGRSLYEGYVTLKNQVSGLEDTDIPENLQGKEDLDKFKREIETVVARIYSANPPPGKVKDLLPEITSHQWNNLDPSDQDTLVRLATKAEETSKELSEQIDAATDEERREEIKQREEAGIQALRAGARQVLWQADKNPAGFGQLLVELQDRLSGTYKFDIFAPNSVNFGLLVTYRQRWKPITYQAGELVSTIPLAPKEVRKFTQKRVVKKKRSEKEIENALRIRKEDSSDTARVDAEIVRKAANKTNFKASAEGGVNFAVWNVNAKTGIDVETDKTSAQTKKDFRESVRKAAEEYKQEHKLEIETTSSEEFEETSSGEISNPNDELPVTYLFYELQRRYVVSERIYRLTPVILVANDVPRPHEIDEDWLIAHDWILRRVILDDSFLPALDYLSESLVGDELSLEVLRLNMEQQAQLVEEIKDLVKAKSYEKAEALELFEAAKRGQISRTLREVGEHRLEASRLDIDLTRDAFDRISNAEIEARSRLESVVSAHQLAVDQYTQALQDHVNRQTEISRLRVHVKENILYYVQAIWDYEPPDQRFFRLYNIDVVDFQPVDSTWPAITLDPSKTGSDGGIGNTYGISIDVAASAPVILADSKKLHEVADLDNLLGYKGNYMIFPLKQSNYLTSYMMQDYIDVYRDRVVLRDPDETANLTTDELVEHMKEVYERDKGEFNDRLPAFRELLQSRLTAPFPEKEEIVVPTDSLFIEALPAKHPILEDFKLAHRALDVKKVQSEVRHAELENVRLADRLLESERGDPDVEKKIVVEGGDGVGVDV
jgi:hypothetical protein